MHHPLRLVETAPGSYSLLLDALTAVDGAIKEVGHEPNGYFYDVITNGFGAMYPYSAQIPPRDRWAILAYLRALQLSRNARVNELPADLREKLMTEGAAR